MSSLELIVEAFEGDFMRAHDFCEKLAGVTLTIPKKAYKRLIAEKMRELGATPEEIAKTTRTHKRLFRYQPKEHP